VVSVVFVVVFSAVAVAVAIFAAIAAVENMEILLYLLNRLVIICQKNSFFFINMIENFRRKEKQELIHNKLVLFIDNQQRLI
jgi:hypothetical protein